MSYQREYERRLRIGVVGCGSHSYRNLLPVLHYLPVKLLAVCDVNRGQAEKCALEYGCRYYENASDMYENEDLEAVFLCVGARQHSALAIEALDAGVHVWMEKPVAVRTEQVEQVIRHRGDRICMVGFKKASMPAARKANALARELGGMELLTATYPMTIPENGEALLAAGDMPNWLRNGVHPLSFLVYLGGRADQVCAVTGKQGTGTFLIKFANGIQGCLNMTPDIQPSIERYGIYGKGWQIEIDNRRVTLAQGIP